MAFVLKYFTREADFDVYLEGTPATKGKLHPEKLFPYDYHPIRPSKDEALQGNDASQAYRDAQALERRRNPSCIEEACAYGNLPAVILMWSQGVVDISTRHALYEGSDATPLMWAALRGHLPIVRFLVDMKADVNATNSLGHTALHWVLCGSQCLEVARFLLDHGADPAQKDKQGNDAAFHAVQNRQLALLAVLLADNPNNNVFNGHNLPSVSGLASVQHLPSYRYRLDTASVDVGGRTLLHWAAYNNSMAMCEFLIEYFGFDVNAVDGVGRTPLLWAAREGFAEVMEYLLSRGADVSVRDNDGIVAKQYARTRNHPDALYVLEKFPPSAVVGSSHNPTENLNQGGDVPQSPRRMDNRGYKSVRQVRLLGTIGMMRHSRLFAFFACAAPVYFLFSYELVRFLSPIVACVLFFSYFFKNVAWTFAVGWPSQGSSSRPKMGGIEITGLATGFRESVCGPWWSRGREAANLFALLSVLFIEVYAWGQAGFTHLVFTPQNPHLTDFLTKPSTTPEGLANPQNYLFGSVLAPFFGSPESMVRGVLLFLLGCILVNVVLFKLTFMRSLIKPQSEGTLRTAPLWRILHHRKYKWLHPRIYSQERHFQIPVRTFHCPHYDAYVQGYDSYSALLDAPIGGSNHRYFVLFLISFLLFQFLFFMWGLNEISVMLQCSSATRCGEWQWYSNALLPFRSRDALKELVERPPTGAPQSTSVVSFSWLSLFMQLWFHGVPNSPYPHNVELVKTYLKEGNLISWAKFIWKYYCVPTHLSSMGVWIFQISFLAFGCAFYMIVRHMGAIIYGCTCIEYANPFAPGSEGDMVLIFPPNMNTATTFVCGENEQEEKYFLAVDPAKSQLNKTVQMGRRCIYGSRFALVNTLRFFLGRHAVEWRNAMTVSNTNTPSRVPLLSA